jgi:hypothetical protein
VLAALSYCREQKIDADRICLFFVPSARSATPDTGPPSDSQFTAYRIRRDVSLGILNMRTGPGQRHPLVVSVPAGARVMIGPCRKPDDGISRYDWCRATWNGQSGWVSSGGIVKAP